MGSREALLLAAALALAATARAGDPDVAQLLHEKGEKAARARQWDEAVHYFERALREHTPLPEAAFGLGEALEKLGRNDEAWKAYAACADQIAALDKPSYTRKRLAKRAEAAAQRLGGVFGELAALDREFVDGCIAFAREHRGESPYWALRAVEHALAVSPDHDAAVRLRAELREASDREAKRGGRSLIGDGFAEWDGSPDHWSASGGVLTGHAPKPGQIVWRKGMKLSGAYTLRAKFRVVEGDKPLYGIFFGGRDKGNVHATMLVIAARDVDLILENHGERNDVRTCPLPALRPNDWHELRVDVRPGEVRGFAAGKEMWHFVAESRGVFDGEFGVFVQQARIEIRDLVVEKS